MPFPDDNPFFERASMGAVAFRTDGQERMRVHADAREAGVGARLKGREVPEAGSELQGAVEDTHKLVHALLERLEPLLRVEPGAPRKDAPSQDSTVPMVMRLRGLTRTIRATNELLEEMLDRLEI